MCSAVRITRAGRSTTKSTSSIVGTFEDFLTVSVEKIERILQKYKTMRFETNLR